MTTLRSVTLRSLIGAASLSGCCLLGASGCVLDGILPDEIDVNDDGTETGVNTDGGEDPAGDDTGDTTATGDGDGDEGSGDGDGDQDTGDGDGDTGDGDGDSGDGDGDGDEESGDGDGDGDTGDGDGDGDELCSAFAPADVFVGANQVEIVDGVSALSSSCGGSGPESVYRFTAPEDGEWQFAIINPEFTEVLALVDSCDPFTELACSESPATVQRSASQGEVVYVVVDSEQGVGTAILQISQL